METSSLKVRSRRQHGEGAQQLTRSCIELLRPLTHPSELANHPTMAQAYLDPALPDMVTATDAKIREERNNLWRAKSLYRYFTGDETWIPCERVEAESDWELFEPNPRLTGRLHTGESPSKRRRLQLNGHVDRDVQIADAFDGHGGAEDVLNGTLNDLQDKAAENGTEAENTDLAEDQTGDVSMTEADDARPDLVRPPQTNGVHKQEDTETETKLPDILAQQDTAFTHPHEPAAHDETDTALDQPTSTGPNHHDENAEDGDNEEDEDAETASTPPPPPRRITRALAAEAETASTAQVASPPPTSPTLSSHSPSTFEPHPLFLLPAQLTTAHAPHHAYPMLSLSLAHSGLPPEELLETRKLLSLYIQKSEETIRGLENILGKLIKAKRRRDKLWAWCVAEGHVGEMSDGEDWIDERSWGLQTGDLKKGRDEDASAVVEGVAAAAAATNVVGEAGAGGGTAAGAGEGETNVIMGGRKGKRRGRAKD